MTEGIATFAQRQPAALAVATNVLGQQQKHSSSDTIMARATSNEVINVGIRTTPQGSDTFRSGGGDDNESFGFAIVACSNEVAAPSGGESNSGFDNYDMNVLAGYAASVSTACLSWSPSHLSA
jgi:hypothetical protein